MLMYKGLTKSLLKSVSRRLCVFARPRPALSPRPDLPSPGPTRRVPRMTAPVCQGVPVCKAGRGVCRDIALGAVTLLCAP